MNALARSLACAVITAGLLGVSAGTATAAKGQDFPTTTCTCQKCGPKGGDVVGKCGSVCKDKEVFSKGSEPYDYCKAAKVNPKTKNVAPPAGGAATTR